MDKNKVYNYVDSLIDDINKLEINLEDYSDTINMLNVKIKDLNFSLDNAELVIRDNGIEINELKKNYNTLIKMSFHMAILLEKTLDFDEFLKNNNLPKITI